MRRTLITLIVLAVLATAGIWAYQTFAPQPEDTQAPREKVVVERGSLLALVNATGTILPEEQMTLSFKTPGRVAEVLVQEGQFVREDAILARLETTDIEYSIAQAELAAGQAQVGLASAQAQLLRALRQPAEYEIAAAEAAVDSARTSYRRLVSGPTPEEIRVARANLDQAEASLEQAQRAYDQVADRPDVAMLPQALQLQQASIAYEVAKANFELTTREPSEAELASAQSAIVQAEANLARLQEGASEEDLLVAQLGVEQAQIAADQAQLSLEQAQSQLEGTTLSAPHDGTITLVGVKAGELSGGQPAFILTDLSEHHVDISVDEIDIGRVAVGQPVTMTLDALPDEMLTGRVSQIAETAQFEAGIVTYKVTVQLDPTDARLRVGMTTNVDIVTERREDVLLVPNRFISIDRSTGRAFVDVAVGNEVQPVEIQLGLRDETHSEVLAGLEEGDVVVLVQESSIDQLREMMGPPR